MDGDEGKGLAASAPKPGWYADTDAVNMLRYWDGSAWTEHRAPLLAPGSVRDLAWLRWGTALIGLVSGGLGVATWRVVAGASLGPAWFDLVPGLPRWAFGVARLQSFVAAVLIATCLVVLVVSRGRRATSSWSAPTWLAVGVALAAAVTAVFWTDASWADYVRVEMDPNAFVRFGGLRSREDFIIAAVLYSVSCVAALWAIRATRRPAVVGTITDLQQPE